MADEAYKNPELILKGPQNCVVGEIDMAASEDRRPRDHGTDLAHVPQEGVKVLSVQRFRGKGTANRKISNVERWNRRARSVY